MANLLDTTQLNTLIDAVAVNIGETGDAAQAVIDKLSEVTASNAAGQAALDASVAKLAEIVAGSQAVEDKLKDAINPNTPPVDPEEPLPVIDPVIEVPEEPEEPEMGRPNR